MSGFEKFEEKFQSNENFCNSLAHKEISGKDYEHAPKVWNAFEMKTMKDYHNLYLKCDNLLLTDVFEQFRNNS